VALTGESTNRPELVPDDLFRIALIDGVALAPRGNLVAMTVRRADLAANRYYSHLQLVPVDGSPTWSLPADAYIDHAASWSPDGAGLAFLSDRTGREQVWLATPEGEMRQLTTFPLGVSGQPAWSPNGRFLAVVVTEADTPDGGPAPIVAADASPFSVTRLCYRADGKGYLGDRYQHIWVVDIETNRATRLTDGPYNDATPAWSPDGREIAFVSNRMDERLVEFRSAVWIVPARGGPARRVTPEDGVAATPAWSPDGSEVAYRGLLPGLAFAPNHQVLLVSATGEGMPRSLTGRFGGHAGGSLFSDTWRIGEGSPCLFWTPNGDAVRFFAAERGRVLVFAVDRDGTVTRLVEGDRACGLLSASSDGRTLAFASADLLHPPDLYVADASGRGERRLSWLNPWLDAKQLSQPQPLAVTSADGAAIDAWLIPPAGKPEPVAGPLVLDVHGGPHSIFGHVFFFDMQLLAAQGYSVLFVNPRATRSYGDDFASCNLGRWGEGDAPDLLAALDAAVKTGWVDTKRVGVIGLSYGGFMTNWLIGHTDRFCVAVSENSLSNLISFYGTSDIGWYFSPEEIGVEPEVDIDRYLRISPLSAADQITAPLLLLNSLEDWRCPIEQAEQLYAALKRRGRTVEMVCFPGESHIMLGAGRPQSRRARHEHLLRWLATHL
jgi:dipeptidyl aminopeptidase/acylaminoacyl peptidase